MIFIFPILMTSTAFLRLFRYFRLYRQYSRNYNGERGPYSVDGELRTASSMRQTLNRHVSALKVEESCDIEIDASSLPSRTMSDSWDRILIPLSSDTQLRLQYINWLGFVRFGMILEELDLFSVWLCYKHNQDADAEMGKPTHQPMAVVTACVDRIDLHQLMILSDRDIVMDGHVSWVGQSSLETTMKLMQKQQDGTHWMQLLKAKFVMVTRHPHQPTKSVVNHPLQCCTPEEAVLFREGQEAKSRRKRHELECLTKLPPTNSERIHLHNIFLQTVDEKSHTFRQRVLPTGHVWMNDSKLKNVIICFPEHRNLYNKIFGGFLMRQAYELAWANGTIFCRGGVALLAVDDIVFRKSVEIGSLLFLASQVCYSNENHLQLRVHAEVVDPESGKHETTNTFYFTFLTRNKDTKAPIVIPKTYSDGMLYLSGKRHFEESARHAY